MPESCRKSAAMEPCASVFDAGITRAGPTMVYDLSVLDATLQEIRQRLDEMTGQTKLFGHKIYYFDPANRVPEIVEFLNARGVGICVARPESLLRAVGAGFEAENIEFSGFGLEADDLATINEAGVSVNLASIPEVRTWMHVAPTSPFGLRVDLACDGFDKRGICLEDLEIAEFPWSNVNGLHIYIGTNTLCKERHTESLRTLLSVARRINSLGAGRLKYVNVGGGFGFDHATGTEFDWKGYCSSSSELLKEFEAVVASPLTLKLELGRSLLAACGTFYCRITGEFEKRGIHWVTVNASVSQFPRPVRYGFDHRFFPNKALGAHRFTLVETPHIASGDRKEILIAGNSHYSKDILGNIWVPKNVIGSLTGRVLAAHHCGAYVDAMRDSWLNETSLHRVVLPDATQAGFVGRDR